MSWGCYGLIAAADFMNGMSYAIGGYRYRHCCCAPPSGPLPFYHRPSPYLGFRYHGFYGPSPYGFDFFGGPGLYGFGRPYYGYHPDPYRTGYAFGELIGSCVGGRRYANYSRDYGAYRDYSGYAAYDYGSYDRLNTNRSSERSAGTYERSANIQKTGKKGSPPTGGKVNSPYKYAGLERMDAMGQAAADPRLEGIGGGGTNWSCSSASFTNDITYATRGTSRLLDAVVAEIRKTYPNFKLVVTSALGTASSPHDKTIVNSHYNPENVKLDFSRHTWEGEPEDFADALMATGYFQFAVAEYHKDGSGWHIDAMFKPEMLAKAARGEI